MSESKLYIPSMMLVQPYRLYGNLYNFLCYKIKIPDRIKQIPLTTLKISSKVAKNGWFQERVSSAPEHP